MKRALLIGINYYGLNGQLSGCVNDGTIMRDLLVAKYAFNKEDCTVITDAPGSAVQPTRDNIRTAVFNLLSGSSSGDTLVLHYSGHGSYVKDTDGDEIDKKDEVIVPVDYAKNGVIRDDELYNLTIKRLLPGVKLYAFFDSCYSGSVLDVRYTFSDACTRIKGKGDVYVPEEWTDKYSLTVQREKPEKGGQCVMFSGCTDTQTSADAYNEKIHKAQGAFTRALVDSLNNYQTPKIRNLLKEVNCRLRMRGFLQTSQCSVTAQDLFENRLFE